MNKFRVGDQVKVVGDPGTGFTGYSAAGLTGEVVVVEVGGQRSNLGIRFDGWRGGHCLDGGLPPSSREGQWVDVHGVELVSPASPFQRSLREYLIKELGPC